MAPPRSLSGSGFPYSPTALRGQGPLVSVDKESHINVSDQPPPLTVGWIEGLCGSFLGRIPSGENQYGWMALQRLGENLRSLHPKAHTVIFDSGKGSLWYSRQLSELVLAQALKFADDAHGLADRHFNSLPRRTKLLHLMVSGNHGL